MKRRIRAARTIKIQVELPILAVRIRQYRERRLLTQEELGEAVGLTRVQISNLERGRHGTNIKTLMDLCDVLDCTADDLLY